MVGSIALVVAGLGASAWAQEPPQTDLSAPRDAEPEPAEEAAPYFARKRFALSASIGQTWSRRANRVIDDEQIYFVMDPHVTYDVALSVCIDCSRDAKLPSITFRYNSFETTIEPWTRDFGVGELTAHTVSVAPFTFNSDLEDTNRRVLHYVDLIGVSLTMGQVASEGGWLYAPGLSTNFVPVLAGGQIKPSVGYSLLNYGMYLKLLPATYIGFRTTLFYKTVLNWEFQLEDGRTIEESIHNIDGFLPIFVEAKIAL